MHLWRYLLRRVLQMIPVLFVAFVLLFALIHLAPGDVALVLAGEQQDPAYIQAVRERYGLDKPLWEQFVIYAGTVVRGDLGHSFTYGRPVIDVVWSRVPATVLLVGTSLLVASILGTLTGALVSRAGSVVTTVTNLIAVASYSVPTFWLGIVLILVFGVELRWFPISGMVRPFSPTDPLGRALDVAWHLALPATTLALVEYGQYLRLARSSVRHVLREDYVTAARAVGFGERTILLRQALRNALLPIVTLFGLQLGLVLSGAVLTETVFTWPGLGTMLFQAILARDVPLVVGAYLVVTLSVVIFALLTDVVYALLDPRVEYR